MKSSTIYNILMTLFIVGIIALSFFLGAFLTYNRIFPYSLIHQSQLGFVAWYETAIGEIEDIEEDASPPTKQERNYSTPGTKDTTKSLTQWSVIKDTTENATDGVNLVCSNQHPTAYLLNMTGTVLHSWSLLPNQKKLKNRQRMEGVYLYPNGDLLAAYIIKQGKQEHRKLAKLNMKSERLWEYNAPVHHEVSVAENGEIYVLIDPITTTLPPGVNFLNTPFLHDQIAILSSGGQEIKRISLINAFLHSDYKHFLDYIDPQDSKGDYTHNNNIEILSTKMAKYFPQFKPGYLLISLRNVNTIAVIDPQSEKVVWAVRGSWKEQHDPDFIENGNILLFDNLGYRGKKKQSHILEISAKNGDVLHEYGPEQDLDFYSGRRGKQQLLENGNLLVVASSQSRLIEWNKKDGIIWELANPNFKMTICGERYKRSTLEFLN